MTIGEKLFQQIALSGDPESTARSMSVEQLRAVRAFLNCRAVHPHAGFPGIVNEVIDEALASSLVKGHRSMGMGRDKEAGSIFYGSPALDRAQGFDAALAGSLNPNRGGKSPC